VQNYFGKFKSHLRQENVVCASFTSLYHLADAVATLNHLKLKPGRFTFMVLVHAGYL